jgi:1,4-alpha-glucan branching enzyme
MRDGAGADARVWAPACRTIDLIGPCRARPELASSDGREGDGHFHVIDPEARAGGRYWFRLDGGPTAVSDPASGGAARRAAPKPSRVLEIPGAFAWTDAAWRGFVRDGQFI